MYPPQSAIIHIWCSYLNCNLPQNYSLLPITSPHPYFLVPIFYQGQRLPSFDLFSYLSIYYWWVIPTSSFSLWLISHNMTLSSFRQVVVNWGKIAFFLKSTFFIYNYKNMLYSTALYISLIPGYYNIEYSEHRWVYIFSKVVVFLCR